MPRGKPETMYWTYGHSIKDFWGNDTKGTELSEDCLQAAIDHFDRIAYGDLTKEPKSIGGRMMHIFTVYVIDAQEHQVLNIETGVIAQDEQTAIAQVQTSDLDKSWLREGRIFIHAARVATYEEYVKPVRLVE